MLDHIGIRNFVADISVIGISVKTHIGTTLVTSYQNASTYICKSNEHVMHSSFIMLGYIARNYMSYITLYFIKS